MTEVPPPIRLSVSAVRSAAACPRVFALDHAAARKSPTRLWQRDHRAGQTGSLVAFGNLFHRGIESFNAAAGRDATLQSVVASTPLDRQRLRRAVMTVFKQQPTTAKIFKKSPQVIEAFSKTLGIYFDELTDIIVHARNSGLGGDEVLQHLFGDTRKTVRLEMTVGPTDQRIQINGRLDYVFHDWRTGHQRIIDYKLTPPSDSSQDLFQVAMYALMHDVQHGTKPDAAVFYLYPQRSIVEIPWADIAGQRSKMQNLVASMVAWRRHVDGQSGGLHPPGCTAYCAVCPYEKNGLCVETFGDKIIGERASGGPLLIDRTSSLKTGVAEVAKTFGSAGSQPKVLATSATDMATQSVLRLGQTEGGIAVQLPASVLNSHVAVVGAAGSGKTYFAKVVAEEAVACGVPILAIDPQGDLVQFLRPAERSTIEPALSGRYDDFHRRGHVRVFTPGSSHGHRVSINPMRLPTEDQFSVIANADRREEEIKNVVGQIAQSVVRLASIGGSAQQQETMAYQLLRQMMRTGFDNASMSLLADALFEPESFGVENSDRFIKKAEREKLARTLQSFEHGPASGLFTGGQPLDIAALISPTDDGRVPINVFYLNALTNDDQKQFFVATLAAEIYRWMVTQSDAAGEQPKLLFYIDEARDYAPAGSTSPAAKEPLVRLFTQGRKFGVAGLICTQSPRSVDYNIFGNCSTKLIGRLEAAQDTARVGEWFATSGPVPAWVRDRNGAARHTFVGRWPGIDPRLEGQPFRTRPLFSLHEGAWSPARLEQEGAST